MLLLLDSFVDFCSKLHSEYEFQEANDVSCVCLSVCLCGMVECLFEIMRRILAIFVDNVRVCDVLCVCSNS